jgi:hypothetical protein
MNIDNRLWKTAVMAAVITLVAGALVLRWGDRFNGNSAVAGQADTRSAAAPGVGPVTFTKIIPRIVVGSYNGLDKYTTIIQVLNAGTTAVHVSGDFFNPNGTDSTTAFTTLVGDVPGNFSTKSLPSASIPANGMLLITGTSSGPGTATWARLTATGSVVINCVFEIRSIATNVLKSRIGVAPSVDNMKQFVIPRIRNVVAGFDVGFALVNTASTTQTLNATLRDANGVPLKTTPITLGPYSQAAMFANELFSLSEPTGATTTYSSITFDSTSPSFAAFALAFEGSIQTGFPVTQLQ